MISAHSQTPAGVMLRIRVAGAGEAEIVGAGTTMQGAGTDEARWKVVEEGVMVDVADERGGEAVAGGAAGPWETATGEVSGADEVDEVQGAAEEAECDQIAVMRRVRKCLSGSVSTRHSKLSASLGSRSRT